MKFSTICNKILKSNPKIRFVGVLNSRGNLVAGKNRTNSPLLSNQEMKMAIHYTFDRWTNLQNLEYKLGKELESITNYEKVTTASISRGKDLFLFSLEPSSNYKKIISDIQKILDSSLKGVSKKTQTKNITKRKQSKKPKLPKRKTSKKSPKHTPEEIRNKLEKLEEKLNKVESQV